MPPNIGRHRNQRAMPRGRSSEQDRTFGWVPTKASSNPTICGWCNQSQMQKFFSALNRICGLTRHKLQQQSRNNFTQQTSLARRYFRNHSAPPLYSADQRRISEPGTQSEYNIFSGIIASISAVASASLHCARSAAFFQFPPPRAGVVQPIASVRAFAQPHFLQLAVKISLQDRVYTPTERKRGYLSSVRSSSPAPKISRRSFSSRLGAYFFLVHSCSAFNAWLAIAIIQH
ncbi:hypothetical protein CPSG_02573 [Coccidioides posadasii str. Silveira]|uniref:Uncharacterized protein n=2 Tax=Coccidioides posadasii TaxID=199306 RepID=E9CXQ3_COCPS|nr:hypothetical protein CPSG_02573 [Coccidioides posadasii str. Silveira]